jgi:protein gp37
MSVNPTNISWADYTWNPITGCSPCSPGCANCYAKDLHDKRHKAYLEGKKVPACYAKPFNEITLFQERLNDPMRLRKPSTIFVCSMGDLFHPDVNFADITSIFMAMRLCKQHTFVVLTKRPETMLSYFVRNKICLPNVWLGVTVCNQQEADEKIPLLLQTPAAHRFVSIEPMLGQVDLTQLKTDYKWPHKSETEKINALFGHGSSARKEGGCRFIDREMNRIEFVICGGETGKNARPMHPDWVRSLRDQCQEADVPFHFKSWGEWAPGSNFSDVIPSGESHDFGQGLNDNHSVWCVGSKRAGHLLDGVEYRAMPGEESQCQPDPRN